METNQSMQAPKSWPICPAPKEEGVGGGLSDEASTRLSCVGADRGVPRLPGSVPCHRHSKTPLLLSETATVLGSPRHRSPKYRHCQPALAHLLNRKKELQETSCIGFDFSPDRVRVRDKQGKCGILQQPAPLLNSVLPLVLPPQPPQNLPPPPHLRVRNRFRPKVAKG